MSTTRAVIAQEEIFGPVLSVIRYRDDEMPSGSPTTLPSAWAAACGAPTPSARKAVARRVQTGSIGINGYLPAGSPFGGVKASGLGREFGPEAVAGYQQLKSIYVMG